MPANATVHISARSGGQITRGDHVLIGHGVARRASDHGTTGGSRPIRLQGPVPGRLSTAVVTAPLATGWGARIPAVDGVFA